MERGFIQRICEVLADTESGLTGALIVRFTREKSYKYGVKIPHSIIPFPPGSVRNKRTALEENIMAFKEAEQYEILNELCEDKKIRGRADVKECKDLLIEKYGHLSKRNQPPEKKLANEEKSIFDSLY